MVDAALKHALLEWSHRRKTFSAASALAGIDVPKAVSKPPVLLAIEKGITLGTQVPAEPVHLLCDRARLEMAP